MSDLEISKKELKDYKKLKIIEELTPLKEYVKILENKYKCSFEEFEKRVKKETENYEFWDVYIEWKAYHERIKELEKELGAVNDAEDIKFTK